jgi:hypothetical protein
MSDSIAWSDGITGKMKGMILMNKRIIIIEGIIQAFIGIGAVIYGLLIIIDPSGGRANMPLELLADSPFASYLIPGVILFLVNGIGHVSSAVLSFTMNRYAGHTGILFGLALIVWIVVQVLLIGYANFLQPFYLILGIFELIFGISMYRQISGLQSNYR